MCTVNRSHQRHLVSDGCPIPIGNSVCGETKTLDIINEFKRLYEEKMNEIDNTSCGDCLQEKLQLQQNWIGDLTEQNEMLVRAVEDLELEATERVKMLEEKLQRSAECICEVMKKYREHDIAGSLLDEPRKRIFNLKNDMTNVLEFLRRIREEKRWNTEGLNFIELTEADLLGSGIHEDISQYLNKENVKAERRSTEKDSTIQKLEAKVGELNSMTKQFQMKKDECENLQKNMIDMRQALTEEVASKHDTVLKLKRECQELEERCIQADKQTAFRDDIIKELRKEIKQLKQQLTHCLEREIQTLQTKNDSVEKDKESVEEAKNVLEKQLDDTKSHIQQLESEFNNFLIEKDRMKEKYKTAVQQELCIAEECRRIELENKKLQDESNELKIELDKYIREKTFLDGGVKQLGKDTKCFLCKVTHEEVEKLNNTIEELRNTLQESKTVREKEDQEKCLQMTTLNEEIQKLDSCLCEANEKLKEKDTEIFTLNRAMKELEYQYEPTAKTKVQTDASDPDEEQLQKLIQRDELIKFQADTLRMLQQELQRSKEKSREFVCDRDTNEENCDGICYLEQVELFKGKLVQSENRVEELTKEIDNKEDIIKSQKDTLNFVEKQLDILRSKESEMRIENEHQCLCIQQLKSRVTELETSTQDAERRANNLQMAVDLYTNTINVLEASEEKFKMEIDRQRTTISNLQEALVAAKNELDNTKQKHDDNVIDHQKMVEKLLQVMSENELEKDDLRNQISIVAEKYQQLQELNFNVEVDHYNSLQDVEGLDHQLFKYQCLLKSTEDELKECKCHLKKLIKQKKSFEDVIQYFKQEMAIMAQQLESLQELLTMSNDTAQEENSKLMSAFVRVQELNQQLTIQLAAAEQKVVLENQMNQLNETKISELERMVSSKEIDIDKHSVTITSIKENLVCSLQQNEALQKTITSLSETVYEFHQCVQKYENDSCKSQEVTIACQNQIESCKEKLTDLKDLLERKTSDLCKIEMAYNNQHRSLMCCQMELKEIKDRQKNKQYYLKCVIEELKDKLNKSEENRDRQTRELKLMQEDLGSLKRKNEKKDSEIGRYRRIISDLKRTLTELNKNLSKKEIPFRSKCNREECKRYIEQFNETDVEVLQNQEAGICVSCPCEVDFYRNVVEALKRAVNEIKMRLTSTQKKNKDLEKELRDKELQVQEISRTQLEKDKEYSELKQKLMERLQMVQCEEAKFAEKSKQFEKEVGSLKRELELKTLQLNEVEKNTQQIAGTKSIQLACAQEEINVLKEQLNKLLRQHCAVNMENEKLHTQSTRMQTTVTNLEERSQLLKGQVEQYLMELQMVQKEKDSLHMRNQDLLRELRALQTSYEAACGQQRYNEETIKSLESELRDVKKQRDDICLESRTVVDYFRLWLQEQKKINEFTVSKEKDYFKTIEMLKQQNHGPSCPFVQSQFTRNINNLRNRQEHCQSPWSLGSQGTSSVHDGSPCRSPCINEGSDWYATNFRNESEDDDVEEDDDDWVTKVENLAAQVRKTNKMWRHKMEKADLTVSKDTKK
ncbi:uncharacterized protein [Diabrotica undecimpunctata]|uniref:uncharacterized protein isoform X3 n=1 Tax=Diabrotica undecimpunctata TaxID=50387 RepID=UPI003B63FB1E